MKKTSGKLPMRPHFPMKDIFRKPTAVIRVFRFRLVWSSKLSTKPEPLPALKSPSLKTFHWAVLRFLQRLILRKVHFVRVRSDQHEGSIIAIVRGKRIGSNGIPRVHIEFIDRFFPLEGIE